MIKILAVLWLSAVCCFGQQWGPVTKFASAAAGGAVTLVQSKSTFVSTTTASITLSSVASGNMVIVVATVAGTAPSLASANCADTVAAYTLNNSGVTSANYAQGSWSRVTAASGSLTITLSPGGTGINGINICAYEVSNLPSKAFDVASKGNGVASDTGSSTTPTTSTFSTASAGIIIATECETTGGAGITHTAGSNFSISDGGAAHVDDNSGVLLSGCLEHRVTSSSLANTTATCTIPSQSWIIRAFAYK